MAEFTIRQTSTLVVEFTVEARDAGDALAKAQAYVVTTAGSGVAVKSNKVTKRDFVVAGNRGEPY